MKIFRQGLGPLDVLYIKATTVYRKNNNNIRSPKQYTKFWWTFRTLIHIIHNDADASTFMNHVLCGVSCYDNGPAVKTLFYYAAESEIG